MCEVTTSTDLENKADKIKQRIEELRINNPKLYAQLNPILLELVSFLDSAAVHVLRQYQRMTDIEVEAAALKGKYVAFSESALNTAIKNQRAGAFGGTP